jgi:hypothetical protein
MRVHRITRSLSGSPLATPWRKPAALLSPTLPAVLVQPATVSSAVDAAIWRIKVRRPCMLLSLRP